MEYLGGYEHALPVTGTTTLRAGVLGGAYRAEGRDYDYYTIGGILGLHQSLPWKLELDLSGGYAYEPYEHHSFCATHSNNKDRIDNVFTAGAELERPITKWLLASARYAYVNNDSNTGPFDYDRHVAGGYLTVLWTH
jgi:hypothetical protein